MTPEENRNKVKELKEQGIGEEVIRYNWAVQVKEGKLLPDQFAGLMFAIGRKMPANFPTLTPDEKKAYIIYGLGGTNK